MEAATTATNAASAAIDSLKGNTPVQYSQSRVPTAVAAEPPKVPNSTHSPSACWAEMHFTGNHISQATEIFDVEEEKRQQMFCQSEMFSKQIRPFWTVT